MYRGSMLTPGGRLYALVTDQSKLNTILYNYMYDIVKREKTTTVHGPDQKMRGYSGYIWNHTRGLVEEKLTTAEESSESVESLALYSKDLKGV